VHDGGLRRPGHPTGVAARGAGPPERGLTEQPIDAHRSDPDAPTRFSAWPGGSSRPRSVTVVIRRTDGGPIGSRALRAAGRTRRSFCHKERELKNNELDRTDPTA
jgi:hypothetical protein